jgi:hypothetical protein
VIAPPLHGFRGDAAGPKPPTPKGLTVAVSRQAGARGGSIARRVGRLLNFPVYSADTLDYLVRDDAARADLLAGLPAGAKEWADATASRLLAGRAGAETADMVKLILALAARGECVVVGRGAGFLLPREFTVHARLVAPLPERIAYMADWLRLTPDEAAEEVRVRDRRREKFVTGIVEVDPLDPAGYDLVLNSGRLGESVAAGLIVQAVAARTAAGMESSAEFVLA